MNTPKPECEQDRFGNYDPSDALLDHLDNTRDTPAPVGTSRRTTLDASVRS